MESESYRSSRVESEGAENARVGKGGKVEMRTVVAIVAADEQKAVAVELVVVERQGG